LDNIACKALYRTNVIIVGTHLDRIKEQHQKHGRQEREYTKDYTERMRVLISKMVDSRPSDNIHVADVVEVSCHPSYHQGTNQRRPRNSILVKQSEFHLSQYLVVYSNNNNNNNNNNNFY
jgi:hypothetical protein